MIVSLRLSVITTVPEYTGLGNYTALMNTSMWKTQVPHVVCECESVFLQAHMPLSYSMCI